MKKDPFWISHMFLGTNLAMMALIIESFVYLFYPADWIAGVDCDPENPETHEDKEDEDHKHEDSDDDSDDDSWVNPDEDRMSPEQEEKWRAELEAWPNNVDTDTESE